MWATCLGHDPRFLGRAADWHIEDSEEPRLTSVADSWHSTRVESPELPSKTRWFPFTATEIEIALAVCGFVAGVLAYAGARPLDLAWGSVGSLVLVYMAGLVTHAASARSELRFIGDGGLRGLGYQEPFRRATDSLLVMHVDDDVPSEELQGLYRGLLSRDIQIRRTIFLRPGQDPDVYRWVAEFGSHENLQQRVIAPPAAATMPFSFAVVDECVVLVAVPGFQIADTSPFTTRLVFRHLLAIRRREVTRAFLEMYERIWEQAQPIAPGDLPRIAAALCSS